MGKNLIQQKISELKEIGKNNNFKIKNLNIRKIKTYSPHEFYIGVDITAEKIYDADVA